MKRKIALSVMAAAMLAWNAGTVHALPAYSFEAPPVNPDGFGPNGGGITVTQSNIGVTNGLSSLGVSIVPGATFVGALTPIVAPAINDPPGVRSILFDLTIPTEFTPGFAVVGVTIFGASQPGPGQQFGLQAQFGDIEAIDGKTPARMPCKSTSLRRCIRLHSPRVRLTTSSARSAAGRTT